MMVPVILDVIGPLWWGAASCQKGEADLAATITVNMPSIKVEIGHAEVDMTSAAALPAEMKRQHEPPPVCVSHVHCEWVISPRVNPAALPHLRCRAGHLGVIARTPDRHRPLRARAWVLAVYARAGLGLPLAPAAIGQ